MFSRTAEYALRAVCVLARNAGESQTTEAIAGVAKVPPEFLRKVLQSLSRGGIVTHPTRGRGRSRAVAPSDQISVLDVVNAVDPIRRIESCPLGLVEHGVELCPMHSQLDDALEQVESAPCRHDHCRSAEPELVANRNAAGFPASPPSDAQGAKQQKWTLTSTSLRLYCRSLSLLQSLDL